MSTTREQPERRTAAPSAGGLTLAGLLVALAVVALGSQPPGHPSVEEATTLLQAASLAEDHDLVYGPRDIARFRSRGWSVGTRVGLGFDAAGVHHFERPLPYPLLAAPFEWLAAGRGVLLLNVLLLAAAAWVASRHIAPVVGRGAPWVVSALVFGSAAFGYVFRAQPDMLLIAAAVGAFALAWRRAEDTRHLTVSDLPQVHPDDQRARSPVSGSPPGSFARWLAVGLLLGIVVAHHPLYLLLALPLVIGVPRGGRAAAMPLLVLGLLMVLLGCWLAGGLFTDFVLPAKLVGAEDSVASLAERSASPVVGAERRPSWPPQMDAQLLGRNVYFLLAGRHVGLLLYFLPGFLALGLGWGTAPLRRVVLTGLLAVVLVLVFFPFNFSGGPAIGNRWLLPFYGVLWLTPARPVRVFVAAAVLLAGSLLMAPLWIGGEPAAGGPAARLVELLPFETTQRTSPVAAEVVRAGTRVRAASAAIRAGDQARPLVLEGGGRGQLMIASERPVEAVELAFGRNAVGEPRLRGGELEQLVFRPDGGVTFRLRPTSPARHPTWWSARAQYVYLIGLEMPETPIALPFAVSIESAGD